MLIRDWFIAFFLGRCQRLVNHPIKGQIQFLGNGFFNLTLVYFSYKRIQLIYSPCSLVLLFFVMYFFFIRRFPNLFTFFNPKNKLLSGTCESSHVVSKGSTNIGSKIHEVSTFVLFLHEDFLVCDFFRAFLTRKS